MCCLSYESRTYCELTKGLPKVGQEIKYDKGKKGKVVSVNPLARSVTVEDAEGKRIDIEMNPKKQPKSEPPKPKRL